MALIACPECGRQGISDQAAACPACAYPLSSQTREPVGRGGRPQPVATVELTGKRWKTMKVWAIVLFLGGMWLLWGSATSTSSSAPAGLIIGVLVLLASLGLGVRASIGAWWHHA
jgi:hypothetical protein